MLLGTFPSTMPNGKTVKNTQCSEYTATGPNTVWCVSHQFWGSSCHWFWLLIYSIYPMKTGTTVVSDRWLMLTPSDPSSGIFRGRMFPNFWCIFPLGVIRLITILYLRHFMQHHWMVLQKFGFFMLPKKFGGAYCRCCVPPSELISPKYYKCSLRQGLVDHDVKIIVESSRSLRAYFNISSHTKFVFHQKLVIEHAHYLGQSSFKVGFFVKVTHCIYVIWEKSCFNSLNRHMYLITYYYVRMM
jgi:hypothetical protein